MTDHDSPPVTQPSPGFDPPSRDRLREQRRAHRRTELRRRLIGIPLVIVALGLVGAGVYLILTDNADIETPAEVRGATTIVGTTAVPTTDADVPEFAEFPEGTDDVNPIEEPAENVPTDLDATVSDPEP